MKKKIIKMLPKAIVKNWVFDSCQLWLTCNTGQFGFNLSWSKWVPMTMINYTSEVQLQLFFFKITILIK